MFKIKINQIRIRKYIGGIKQLYHKYIYAIKKGLKIWLKIHAVNFYCSQTSCLHRC